MRGTVKGASEVTNYRGLERVKKTDRDGGDPRLTTGSSITSLRPARLR